MQYLPPNPFGDNFAAAATIAGNVNLVTAAANVNGLVITALAIQGATGGLNINIVTSTTAPAAINDVTKQVIRSTTGAVLDPAHLGLPLFVPAGLGVFLYASSTGGKAWLSYYLK